MENKELTRHQRRRLRTRSQLMQAALELLLETGYDNLTVQHITDRADLGRGTFYIHFKDKEDIVWTIIKEGLDEADREAHQKLEQLKPEQPELFGYSNVFRHAEQNRDLYRIMLGSQGSSALTARVNDYLAADLQREMQKFGYPFPKDIPIEITAQAITGAAIRLIIWWLEIPNDYTAEDMARMLYGVLGK